MQIAKNFIESHRLLIKLFIYSVKGKDRGKSAWHYILVDRDKKDEFLEQTKTGSVDVADYGKILASGWGQDISPDFEVKVNKFDFEKYFVVLRFKTEECVQTYYALSDVDKQIEMKAASSVEDISHCGMILYSSFDEDPPEALVHVFTSTYFGLDSALDWNAASPFGAVLNRDLQDVQKYLNSGSDINLTDSRGWTLLHHFTHCGKMDIVSFLKSKGADIQVRDKIRGRKPVHIAARESNIAAISFFLKNGAIVNEVDENNWTLLHYAAWKGDVKTVRYLIENQAEINAKDRTVGKKPIHIAAEWGHTHVVEAFLENSACIEEEDDSARTPLYYAVWMGHLETARCLIGKGADIHKKTLIETMPIHAATTYENNEKVIDLLLDHGVNIDELDGDGNTPLHRAVGRGDFKLIQHLINKKANLTIVNKKAETPRDLSKEHTDIYLYLTNRMGIMLEDEEKYSDALKCCEEMLEIQKEKLGPNHPETLNTLTQKAKLLYKLGQYDVAEVNFKDVLEARERCLGGNYIDIFDTKHKLGLVYYAQIKYSKAMEIFKEVYEKRKSSLGVYCYDTLNVARDIGYVHFKKGELDEAFEIFQDIYEKRRVNLGENHQDTLQSKQDMAVVLVNKGNYKIAMQTFKDVLQKRQETLGDNHPDTLFTKDYIFVISKKFATELKQSDWCLIM